MALVRTAQNVALKRYTLICVLTVKQSFVEHKKWPAGYRGPDLSLRQYYKNESLILVGSVLKNQDFKLCLLLPSPISFPDLLPLLSGNLFLSRFASFGGEVCHEHRQSDFINYY